MSPGHRFLGPMGKVFAGSLLISLAIFLSACGNTFRPIAIPIEQAPGNPGTLRNAIVVSSNGSGAGSTEHIDVAGDTVSAVHTVGAGPTQAILIGGQTWVPNSTGGTLTAYTTFGGPGTSTVTVTMPAGACPVALSATQTSQLYVADPGSGCVPSGPGSVDVIHLATASFGGSVAVGNNPVAIAELPNATKIYVANQGSNSVTVINALDNSIKATVPVGSSPSFLTVSPDNACVYVTNQGDGTVSVINTSSDAVVPAGGTVTTGAGPSFMIFDPHLQRVYVANTAGNSVTVLSHNNACTPTMLKTVAVGAGPKSIAPLADGTRVYVAASGSNSVSVINASSLTLKSFANAVNGIPVGANPVSIAAAPDSSRVYVANHDSGDISTIQTGNDTEMSRRAASSPNPVFVLVTP